MSYSGASGFDATEMIIFNAFPSTEFDTSSSLCALVESGGTFKLGETLTLIRCDTSTTLVTTLQSIAIRAAQGSLPIIHIDGHASADALSIPSGETIDWEIIYSNFRKINIETKNNLFVSMGACEALQSFRRAIITQPCPFNALLAAWDPILESAVQVGMETFYNFLFKESGNVDLALGAMRKSIDPCPLQFFSSKDYLERGLKQYVQSYCIGDGWKARVETVLEYARTQAAAAGRQINMQVANKCIEEELSNTPATLREMAEKFLHISGSNENAKRFAPDLEATLADIQIILDSDRK